jgi:hypothetical protein
MQKIVMNMWWVLLFGIQATAFLIPQDMGVCEFTTSFGDAMINVSQDLDPVPGCSTCGELFGVGGTGFCDLSPCDGMQCFADGEYRITYVPQNRCGYLGVLQEDCSQCDTECLETCNIWEPEHKASEEELVICGFNLTSIGTTSYSLCSGTVGSTFCENAELYNRTCFVAEVKDNDIEPESALIWENCAPVFSRTNDDADYWACPMDSPVTGSVGVYDTTYCGEFAQHYGEPMNNGYYPGEEEDGSTNGDMGLRLTRPFYLV